MRKIHFAFLFCIIFACKKNSVDPAEVRLQSITSTNSANTNVFVTYLEYDAQGRIIYISGQTNGGTKTTSYSISYPGNEIVISPVLNEKLKEVHDIKYTVNSEGLPMTRIEYQYMDLNGVGIIQKNKSYDTTFFEYNSSAIPTKITERKYDSASYIPMGSPAGTTIDVHVITTVLNNENNVLKSSIRTDLLNSTTKNNGSSVYFSKSSTEYTANYEYQKNYSNQLDYYNLVVMRECLHIFNTAEYLNRNYKNLPDKISDKDETKDENGKIISTYSFVTQVELGYNKHGFLSSFKTTGITGITSNKTFAYNK